VGGLTALLLLTQFYLLFKAISSTRPWVAESTTPIPDPKEVSNVDAIGQVLYTDYIYPFQMAGIILLVAMIGAIVLTLRQRTGVRKQVIAHQIARKREDSIVMMSELGSENQGGEK
jgi:NADH-quinone oxidoreductase subunit J